MPYVETTLGRLFVRTRGAGPPVTFWHCFLGDSSMWSTTLSAIDHRAQTIDIEGPSHGRSAPCRRPFTLEECADAWVDVLNAQGVNEPAVFCGLSWGAMVALRVAIRHPKRVRGLLLFSTIATQTKRKHVLRFTAFAQTVRWLGLPDRLIAQMEPTMVSRATRSNRPELVHDMLARNRSLDRLGLYQCAMATLVQRTDIVDQLWRVQAPTRIVAGRHDRTTPPSAGRLVARAIDGAVFDEVDDVGHLVTLEAPEASAARLGSFLDELDARQS